MLEKIYRLFSDREIEFRERLFRVILMFGIIATILTIIAGLFLENIVMNTIPLLILIVVLVIACVATFRYHKMELAATVIGFVMICLDFPITFFLSGGLLGGSSVWMVLGILYIFLLFSGKKLAIFLVIAVAADFFTYIVAYQHPRWVVNLASRSEIYYDSLFAVLVVGIMVGCIMKFQLMMYEKERQVTLEQKETLEKLSSSKNDFFSYVSHEIRTPINTIIGLNEMILREDVSQEVAEDARNVRNAGKLLLSLVNDILDLAKIENKKMEIIPVEYSTREMFSELIQLISVRMKEKNLEFIVNVDADIPSVLYGDEKRIQQVIINILTNAVKYTERGSVTFSVEGESVDDSTIKLSISVADTGVGIKREDMKNLFQSFQRADLAHNSKIEGSGLGLSIVKQFLDLMGGNIKVNSIYGKGSIFTVTLEQKVVDHAPIDLLDYKTIGEEDRNETYRKSFEASGASILIVDDDEKNLLVATKLLRATKVGIDTAASGKECLEYTKNRSYHVILLDYMMPEMDGLETLHRIRSQEDGLCQKAPVIVLTGNASPEDEKRFLRQGFDGYLAKPVDGRTLETEILSFLPKEVVEYREDISAQRGTSDFVQKILKRRKRKIIIASDAVCDLPRDLRDKYDIRLMHSYIVTDKGNFRDTEEIGIDNFFQYMSDMTTTVSAVTAPVEEFEEFFAQLLTEAESVIYVSMSAQVGRGYAHATQAAKEFYHVSVVDSEQVSGGEGLMVLYAARLAQNGCSVEEICAALEKEKKKVEMSMMLSTVDTFYENGYISKSKAKICDYFHLHPVVKSKHGVLAFCGVRGGKLDLARKHFVQSQLFLKNRINTDIAFITYVGCTVEQQNNLKKQVEQCVPFDRLILQRCSVPIVSNAGLGIIAITYIRKDMKEIPGKTEFSDL